MNNSTLGLVLDYVERPSATNPCERAVTIATISFHSYAVETRARIQQRSHISDIIITLDANAAGKFYIGRCGTC